MDKLVLDSEAIQAIIDGCEGVTPGPWVAFHDEPSQRHYGRVVWALTTEGRPSVNIAAAAVETHAYIARLSPEVVRSIATQALEASRMREALKVSNETVMMLSDCFRRDINASLRQRIEESKQIARAALNPNEEEKINGN